MLSLLVLEATHRIAASLVIILLVRDLVVRTHHAIVATACNKLGGFPEKCIRINSRKFSKVITVTRQSRLELRHVTIQHGIQRFPFACFGYVPAAWANAPVIARTDLPCTIRGIAGAGKAHGLGPLVKTTIVRAIRFIIVIAILLEFIVYRLVVCGRFAFHVCTHVEVRSHEGNGTRSRTNRCRCVSPFSALQTIGSEGIGTNRVIGRNNDR